MSDYTAASISEYRTLVQTGHGEYEEKKSRFLCDTYIVHTEEEALGYIAAAKKKYWDARHNCYAYILGDGSETMRFSDDGEPSGTAGKPILEVLKGENLTYTLAIVTRYFGGTLLGTGGLVRAYTAASQAALEESEMVWMRSGHNATIRSDYSSAERIKRLLENADYSPSDIEYGADVTIHVPILSGDYERISEMVREQTAGSAEVRDLGMCHVSVK